MDPSLSSLVNIITELQQEKRDVRIASEKKVADLELELRIEQQRNGALMAQLIEVLGDGPARSDELMHQLIESLENKQCSRHWAEQENGDQPYLSSQAVVEAVTKAVNTLTESAVQVQRALPEAEMRLSRKHSVMRMEVEKALAASTTELMNLLRTSQRSSQHITRYDEVNTEELVENINNRLTNEHDENSLVSKVAAKMGSQATYKLEASEKAPKGTYKLSLQSIKAGDAKHMFRKQ
ncbi:Aldo-keto reductase yakc [NADP(+)] [Venturia nashicola]|uniref:Aldo-keto reductase yakc [NADP(+)] n=1 Tax=Venturia nashicola TaxID=86259 RepID=A0A4Z1NE01_9PEZI|nr:Aldo-keto reductase yakc [NADP(+)] [Venturia nashicola]TLD18862.1 Aldo-keto reductase yakc [NADP(+)] [Venturia nashicola]